MEAIDLGLSVKWSSCNLGAISPSESGDFFAFGETGSKDIFLQSNYLNDVQIENFNGDYGIKKLALVSDVANFILGDKWRMPTRYEVQELIENCNCDIGKLDGVFGTQVYAKNGNSIFLPSTGRKVQDELVDERRLYYWLSTIRNNSGKVSKFDDADGMGGDQGWIKFYNSYRVYVGRCIRPVMDL